MVTTNWPVTVPLLFLLGMVFPSRNELEEAINSHSFWQKNVVFRIKAKYDGKNCNWKIYGASQPDVS